MTQTPNSKQDWFITALNEDRLEGLNGLKACLEKRLSLVSALEQAFNSENQDRLETTKNNIRSIEYTLNFRLGILRPERPAAWFRSPTTTSPGPFSGPLLAEPIFLNYDLSELEFLEEGLTLAWKKRDPRLIPFKDLSRCLWRTLISTAAELEELHRLPSPYQNLRFEDLNGKLAPDLQCDSIDVFLSELIRDLNEMTAQIEQCFEILFRSSKKLWDYQRQQRQHFNRRGASQANDVRAEFRKRRQARTFKPATNHLDTQSLQFMGFDDFPSANSLRTRYLELAKKFHPDTISGSEVAFQQLNQAYSHLNRVISR